MASLTHNEIRAFLADGTLPGDFRERIANELLVPCENCDGLRCKHFVLRDWYNPEFDDCDGRCCPFCSDDPVEEEMYVG